MNINVEYSHAFQPIFDIESRKIVSYEVLLRGKNNESPMSVFNQVPSESLMDFDQASRERAMALAVSLGLECSLNLNFTPGSILFENGKYLKDTIIAAQKVGLKNKQIIVEITEGEAISNTSELKNILNYARRSGMTIAIDDFGAGYSGLNLLADMQPDWVKLDMYLLRNIEQHGARQSIVRAICSVCFDLGIDVLAEGVETLEEFRFLEKLNIPLYQGYFFAKPGFETLPTVSKII
ncbi:MAG: EAL domain-containing protein [Psychromonas sp.]